MALVSSDAPSTIPTEGAGTSTPREPLPTDGERPPLADPNKPKRGRGRPRKNPEAPPKPPKDPNAPKRGRGRPRKNPVDAKPRATSAAAPVAVPAAAASGEKRGRGRPRKNPAPEAGTSDVEDPSFDPGKLALPSALGVEGVPAPKKKRGRPKKVVPGTTADGAEPGDYRGPN